MKLYKLLYRPLGLYYTPNKGNGNLSKIGKIYRIKPNPKEYNVISVKVASWSGNQTAIQKAAEVHFHIPKTSLRNEFRCKVDNTDWEVVEIQSEIQSEQLKTFLVTFSTGDPWELCNGVYAIFAIDSTDAFEQFRSKYKYSVISVTELCYAPERGYNEKIIEITQPVVE